VEINYALASFIDKNLDYWQFLLYSPSDFTLVASSCDRILHGALEIVQQNIDGAVRDYPEIKQAQVCKDIEYLIKSMPFFKKIIVRRATQGAGKLSVSALASWFNLEAKEDFIQAREGLEMGIKSKMNS